MKLTNSQINEINNSIQYLMNRVDEEGRPVETSAWFALYVNSKRFRPLVEDLIKDQMELLQRYCKIEEGKILFDGDVPVFLSEVDKETYIRLFSELISSVREVDVYQINAEDIKSEKFDMETLKPLLDTIIITE